MFVGYAPSCHFDILDKLQTQICRAVRLSIVGTLEPWAHYQNMASLRFFFWH